MQGVPPEFLAFWSRAEREGARIDAGRFYEAFAFGDSEALSTELSTLVLQGTKRATASLAWTYAFEGRSPPGPGDLSIVTSWARQPLCIIETRSIEPMAFEDVTAAFAEEEGEGDRTLATWRRDHEAYYARECARIGRTPHARMPVLCERFAVAWQPAV